MNLRVCQLKEVVGKSRSFQRIRSGVAPSPALVWSIMAAFAFVVAFFGGSSRPDPVQIVALRPLAALFLIPALYVISREELGYTKIPLLLFGALLLWMLIQIIPLPSSLWRSLPDRAVIFELDSIIGSPEISRPISMVPSRAYNALASMIVPAAAIALVLAFRLKASDVFVLIAAMGIVDAGLGVLQLMTGANGPFYQYAITNRGFVVGLFANENHSAVFSGLVMIVAARIFLNKESGKRRAWFRIFGASAFVFALLAVFISGSRAGFATGLIALAASIVMVYTVTISGQSSTKRRQKRPIQTDAKANWAIALIGYFRDPVRAAMASIVTVILLSALFLLSGRAAGLENIFNQNAFDGLRFQLFPILQTMASTHWFLGTGFGSFEEVYHLYEPTELLKSQYVNQAHNDWLQLVIEGGLPAIMMLIAFLVWFGGQLMKLLRAEGPTFGFCVFWVSFLAILMFASVPDYPLRTPIFQIVAVWLVLGFAGEVQLRSGSIRPQKTV